MCCRGVTGVSVVRAVLGAGRDRTAALTAGCTLLLLLPPPTNHQHGGPSLSLSPSTEYLLPPTSYLLPSMWPRPIVFIINY